MIKRAVYVESLRSELKGIRKKLYESAQNDTICSIDKISRQTQMHNHYEGMEYLVREVVRKLEMGKGADEIQATLLLNEARCNKIIHSKTAQPFNWRQYAKGALEAVGIVRALMS